MRRGGNLRRDTPKAREFERRGRGTLTADPVKTAGWQNRTRERARQAARGEGRVSTLRPGQRKRKVTIPRPVRRRVLRRTAGLCICCGRRATQVHHVLPEEKFPELALIEDNMVGVHHDCHARHTNAFIRIPRTRLPKRAIELAKSRPLYMAYLERTYPESDRQVVS